MENIVEIKDLRKVFKKKAGRGKTTAIDNITLNVRKGEVFGIIGPNGSGKTTLIKLMLGFVFPTSGSIKIFGKKPIDAGIKEKIGFVSELPYFYEFLTPSELMRFYGGLFDIPKNKLEPRITSLIELVGLSEYSNNRIRTFSKGMLQRLGIAIGLVNDPELLFFDEPVLGLDPIGTRQIKELIKDLKKRQKTIILTSHVLQDASEICDTLAVLDKGQVVALGNPADLLSIKDNIEITVEGLSDSAKVAIRKVIEENGARILSMGYKKANLTDFFINLIEQRRTR